jgi:hypothetical protein
LKSASLKIVFCDYNLSIPNKSCFWIRIIINIAGGVEMGVLEGCLIAEELAYGCSGMKTAIEGSGLGVSTVVLIQIANFLPFN